MRASLHRALTLAAILALATAAAACGGGGSGNSVNATEKDFSVTLDPTSVSAGEVTFDITNDGPSAHEFVVFRTDLTRDKLPTTTDDSGAVIVDEEGQGVEHVDEVEDIAPNSDATLTVDLAAGSYVVICNLPAHYQQGMHAALTVTG